MSAPQNNAGVAGEVSRGMAMPPLPPVRILMSIGTDHHQFPRVIDWLDAWLGDHPGLGDSTLVQHGQSKPSLRGRNMAFVPYDDLLAAMAQCQIVITHGGPATIFEARAHGVLPISVPRRPELGEIVDHHQERFARHLARDGLVALCEDEPSFRETMDGFLAHPDTARVDPDTTRLVETMHNLDELIERLAPADEVRRRHEHESLARAQGLAALLHRRSRQGV